MTDIDPTTKTGITGAQVRAAYDALGLDPDRFRDCLEFMATSRDVVVRYRHRDTDGQMRQVNGELVERSARHRIDWSVE